MLIKRKITITSTGYESTTTFNKKGHEIYFSDNKGSSHKMDHEYDDENHLISTTIRAYHNSVLKTKAYKTYDICGNITSYDDGYGHKWEYEYDKNNNLILSSNSNGKEIRHVYDEQNRHIKSIEDDQECIFEYFYDADMNMYTCLMKNSMGKILMATEMDDNMKPIHISYAGGSECSYTYDKNGKCILSNNDGVISKMKYNSNGDLIDTSISTGFHSSSIYEYWTEKELQED